MKFTDNGVGPCSDCGADVNINSEVPDCMPKVLCPQCQGDYIKKEIFRESKYYTEIIIDKGKKETEKEFYKGVVSALDVVALQDDSVIFKEIIKSCGVKETLKEIKSKGLDKTKSLAKQEFPKLMRDEQK